MLPQSPLTSHDRNRAVSTFRCCSAVVLDDVFPYTPFSVPRRRLELHSTARLLKNPTMIKKSSSIILGIDPGFGSIGYGAISVSSGNPSALNYGCLHTKPGTLFSKRLLKIFDDITQLIHDIAPDVIGVEKLFFEKNSKTAIEVSHARGVILLAAERAGIPIIECTPLQVKLASTGYGKADKRQVQQMITRVLKLKEVPKPDDTADALAIALCASSMPIIT